MGKTTRHRYLGLMGAVILLGYLFFSMGDATAVSDGTTTGDARIRVEEGQGFTRIVFPCDRPEAASVEPDLAKARFLVRLPGGGAKITVPRLGAGHPLVKGVTILPDSERGARVQVLLTSGLVDWISYRYERPPRAVLYVRARLGSNRSEDGSSGFSVSQKQEKATAKKREATLEDRDKSPAQTEKSADLVKTSPVEKRTSGTEGGRSGLKKDTSGVERGDKNGEDLWRLSAADIPEFVRFGTAYPPDFRDMKADQRRLYLQALEKFGDRDFSEAKEIASKIVPKDSLSWLAETLAFFTVDCDFRIAEEEGDKEYTEAIQGYREAMNQFPESRFVPDAVLMMATGYRRMEFFQEATVQYQLFLTWILVTRRPGQCWTTLPGRIMMKIGKMRPLKSTLFC